MGAEDNHGQRARDNAGTGTMEGSHSLASYARLEIAQAVIAEFTDASIRHAQCFGDSNLRQVHWNRSITCATYAIPKSPSITRAAFRPGIIETPGPGWLPAPQR